MKRVLVKCLLVGAALAVVHGFGQPGNTSLASVSEEIDSSSAEREHLESALRGVTSEGLVFVERLGRDLIVVGEKDGVALFLREPAVRLVWSRDPYVRLARSKDSTTAQIEISSSLLEILANLSRAKAIDERKRAYLDRYLRLLINMKPGEMPPKVPDEGNLKLATGWIKNEAFSNFSQALGYTLSLPMACERLGYNRKHGERFGGSDGRPLPIYRHISANEWKRVIVHGADIALHAGLGVDGFKALSGSISRFVDRPTWAEYIFPTTNRHRFLSKELDRIEEEFFGGYEGRD